MPLPPELLDHVLDYLHDDKLSLRHCSLTSRNWLPRAQHHLFHSIDIDSTTCNAFTRLLESNPSLGSHVANMAIEGVFGFFSLDRNHSVAVHKWLRTTLPRFSHLLHNLTKLELALMTIDATLVGCVFGNLATITQLTLYACTFTSSDVFVQLFLSYPRMKRLDVAWFQVCDTGRVMGQNWDISVPQGIKPPQLVSISTRDGIDLLKWLIFQDLHRSIASVTVWRIGWQQLSPLPLLLTTLASTLRDLRVGWEQAVAPDDWSCPAITSLPSLSSLTVDFHSGRTITILYSLLLLTRLSVPALRTVTFAITCKDVESSQEVPWMDLATGCACMIARGTPLRRIVVTVGMSDEADGVGSDFLCQELPLGVYEVMQAKMMDAFKAQKLERMVSFVIRAVGHC